MNKRMTISLISILFFIGILLMMLPDIQDIPEERMTSISMVGCVSDIKIGVENHLKNGQPINTSHKNICPELITELKIFGDGKIEMFNQTHKIRLSLSPALKDGLIRWSCQGTPEKFVPRTCRIGKNKKLAQ